MRHYHQPSFWDEIKGILFDHSGRISASTYTSSMALVLFYYVFVQYILIPYIVQPLCGPLTPVFAFLLVISFSSPVTVAWWHPFKDFMILIIADTPAFFH